MSCPRGRPVRRLKMCIIIFGIILLTCHIRSRPYNFDGFNNETGVSFDLVPNLIHSIRLNKTNFSFVDIIVIRAAHLAQKPNAIYIHTNVEKFDGKYWLQLQNRWPDTYQLLQIKPCQIPRKIFTQPLSSAYELWHASDFLRYGLLKKYGGIYLDTDAFLIKNLDFYRKFEMTLEWNDGLFLGNQVLIGHKDARFLRDCLETFRDYRPHLWYYNGGELPTKAVLYQHPEFIHRVKNKFGTNTQLSHLLFAQNSPDWKEYDAIHLLINHRYPMYKDNYAKYPNFDESTILQYNFTFGQMMRHFYFS